jgi:predicted O-methyltransferase YrrM
MRNPHAFETIVDYCEKMSSDVPEYLQALERETYLKMLSPQMISGSHLGQFLTIVSTLLQPKCVIEVGSFTGYATLCLWKGLAPGGQIHTYEVNPETKWLFDKYVDKAGAREQINQHFLDPLSKDHEIPGPVDLSWIDADKRKNLDFFEKILNKTRVGGLIMIDNTLWSGKVLDENVDPITESIQEMNITLARDERVSTIMLPIRDGITLAVKK